MPSEQIREDLPAAQVDGARDGVLPPLVEHDVRRKRPPALSFLLRWETARRLARVVSLLVLDFAAVYLAILTALSLKAAVRDRWDFENQVNTTDEYISFVY